MLPQKPRHFLYALVLLLFSVIGTMAIANNEVHSTTPSAPMFMTIVQGADEVVTCVSDGAQIARFILCGDSDDRTITLSGGPYSNYSWEQLTGAAPNTNSECPDTASAYTQVATTASFNLDASAISAATGAEFRVRANNGTYHYIEVVKSTITQTFTKRDFICNTPGRIEITGLPNSYQFRMREGSGPFGPYQASSIFPDLAPGFYTVQARLNISGQVCEYQYRTIEIEQLDLDILVDVTNPTCAGEVGSIDVEVQPDNVGPYTYTLLDENGAEIEFTSTLSSNTHTFNAVSEGIYAIKVETNECKENIPAGIMAPIQYNDRPGNTIEVGQGLSAISVDTDTNGMSFGCSTISSVDIDVTPTGGSGTYTYTVEEGGSTIGNSGGSFSGTRPFTVNNPGTYTFYITDDQGCTAEKSEYVAELDPPVVTADPVIGTCTNGGGKVQFNPTNPKGFNLEYRATNNTGDPFTNSPTIPVADGTYSIVEVRYSQGAFSCVLSLPAVTVTSEGGLNGNATLTQDYTCTNGEGIITLDVATGGSGGGYEYSIDNVNYGTGRVFGGLTPGSTYIPYIKDSNNCYQALAPITIAEPVPPSAINFAQDNLDCAAGTSRVTIDVQPTGFSVAEYRVVSSTPATTLPPAQTSNVFNGLRLDTSYQFEIEDAEGCVYNTSYTTGGFSSIRARVKSGGDRRVCPSATDGNGAFLIDGFALDYDYVVNRTAPGPVTAIDSGTSSDLEIPITNLGAGTYEIMVTDNDTNCISSISFDVAEAATTLGLSPDVTDMSCQNNNIGRVRANASGGFGGYRYELDWPATSTVGTQGPKSGSTFGNLTEIGTYTLRVIDSEGCEFETTFSLAPIDAPSISLDSADYCYTPANRAEITVSSTPGSEPLTTHQYRINGGTLQTPVTPGTFTFDNLVPGNYTVEVVDGSGCTAQTSNIRIPPQVQVDIAINREIDCGGTGEMQITVSGGDITDLTSTSYTIFRNGTPVSGHTATTLPSASFPFTMSFTEFGDYTVSIEDNNGCTDTSEALNFAEPQNIAATERVVATSCGDDNSGFVEIIPTVSSGVPPFEVVFAPENELQSNPLDPNSPTGPDPINYSFSDQTIYSGLTVGNYEYVVKDARNCVTAVIPVTITNDPNPAPEVTATPIDATCTSGDLSGGVTVDLTTAGSPDYTVIIEDNFGNPFVTRNNVSTFPISINDPSLEPGDYRVAVLDARGCSDIEPFTIASADLDIVPDYPTPPATCVPGGTTVCVDLLGGSFPEDYEVRLVEDPAAPWQTPNTAFNRHCFNNLLFGVSYTVEVRDVNTLCTYEEVITLPNGPGTDVTLAGDYRCGVGEVELQYTIGSGTPPFNIEITNLDTGTVVFTDTASPALGTAVVVPTGVDLGRYGIAIVDAGDCSAGDEIDTLINTPRVDVIENRSANCNALGQLTVRGSGGTPFATGSPYLYAFVPAGTPVDNDGTLTPTDDSDDFSDASTVALPGSLGGTNYDIWVRDANNCAYRISAAVVQLNPDLPLLDPVVNNQCDVTATAATGFDITLSLPGDFDTPTFTLNGVSQTVTNSGDPAILTTATFTVNSVGSYPYNIIDANGCDIDGVAEVFQVLSASGDFSSEPSCENADGQVTITADGGSGDFSYRLTGTDMFGASVDILDSNSDGIFENVAPGDYEVLVTDNQVDDGTNQCTFTVDGIVRAAPITPVIDDVDSSNISCNGEMDGSASLNLVNDPDPNLNPTIQEYNLYSSDLASMPGNLDTTSRTADNLSGTFTGLAQGTYVIEVVTDRNCFARRQFAIAEPPAFSVNASAGMLMCEVGANRFSTTTLTATVTGAGNGPSYGFKIDPADSYQTTNTTSMDFVIVDNGMTQTFEVYAIDSNGCEFVSNTVTIAPPSTVTGLISQLRPMDCENPERIRIEVSGTTDFTIEDVGNSVAPVADQVVSGPDFVEFDLPQVAGEYRLQINDNGGCTYPLEPYTVIEPVLPTVSISQNEPVGCYNAIDGILNIEITNLTSLSGFTGIYEYTVYDAADAGFSGGAFGTPVPGNSTGVIDIATAGNPAVITGLPTGNLRVVVREQGKTVVACDVFSDVSFIDTPSEDLEITDIAIISPVGCNDDLGEIVVTTKGGWETAPYEYRLEYENPIGSGFGAPSDPNYATFAANGANNRFTGLSSGNYRVTVRDDEGCEDVAEEFIGSTPIIEAEALITRELQCPSGTDAVITAIEPGTTTPGAIGGVPGGGYKYRLIELDSTNLNPTDPTSHLRTSGLQDEPEFEGTSGTGVIPAGWYTIEVVSTMDCQAFTPPIQVIPPPAIRPVLIQTSVPACGNDAAMMIRVNNPQGGSYEYRRIFPTTDPRYLAPGDPSIVWEPVDETDAGGLPVKTGIPGTIGEGYRFEVRNVVGSSTCLARKTNGITITDADPLSLDIASPTFDISCNGQVDGRIEAFAEGGTGIYEYRIYDYDPGSDAFAAEFLPTYDPTGSRPPVPVQDFGTFENLEQGSYYISVISRLDCGIVQGPFVIDEPAQVVIDGVAEPTSCLGETDGIITMNVTSMTGGLVKFAIEPNLSEFFSDPDNPTTYTFTDLAANTPSNPSYTVLAQDAEGCPQTFEFIVTEPDELRVTGFQSTPETCIDAADGSAIFTIAGGTPFVDTTDPANPVEYYETRIVGPDSDGTEIFERNDSMFLDNLPGGVSYIVFIRDANLCDTYVEIPVEIGVDLTAEPIVEYGCEGIFPNSTTRIELDDDSRIEEILFALDPVDPSDAITSNATEVSTWGDLPAGDHSVYIYHENGCATFVEFTIDAYEPLTLDAQKTGPNELTAVASGGFGGYQYSFNDESYGSEGVFTTTESGVVEVRVIDQRGCIVTASIPFEFTGMLELPNFFTPNGDNENDFWSPRNRQFFPDIEVIIYDRYGRVVAELDQVSQWDGLYDGNELPSGDYWYVVNQNDKRDTRYVGHFTLYR